MNDISIPAIYIFCLNRIIAGINEKKKHRGAVERLSNGRAHSMRGDCQTRGVEPVGDEDARIIQRANSNQQSVVSNQQTAELQTVNREAGISKSKIKNQWNQL